MPRKTLAFLAFGLIALGTSGAQAAFQDALQGITATGTGPSPSVNQGGPSQSLGFDFTPKVPITVQQLGVFQVAGGPSILGQQVELYDVSTMTVLYSTVVTAPVVTGTFNYEAITPILLNTTDTYSVISLFSATSPKQYATGVSTATLDIKLDQIGGSSYATGYTHGTSIQPLTKGFANLLVTNFEYSTAAVPEPASLAMFGLGLAGVVLFRRKTAKVVA